MARNPEHGSVFAPQDPRFVTLSSQQFAPRAAAIILASTIVFLVLTAFLYDLWPPAAACSVLFATCLWLLTSCARGTLPFVFSYTLPFLVFLPLWGVVQLLTARTVFEFGTLSSVILLSGAVACYWIGCEAFQFPKVLHGFRQFLIVFGVLMSLVAIAQMLTTHQRIFWLIETHNVDKPMASFLNRDRYSAFIELLLPLALVEVFRGHERWALYAVGAGVMFASVVGGGSRAGLILVVLEIVVVLATAIYRDGFTATTMRPAAVILALAAVLATAAGWRFVLQQFAQSDPFRYRREFLISSLAMFRARPWMGFGLGSWPSVYPRFAIIDPGRFVNHAHDDWAEWACDGGIPFLLAWLAIAGRTAARALRSPEALGVTIVFLHSVVDFNFYNYPIVILVAVLIAAAERSSSDQSAEPSRPLRRRT
ncbi:MAG TPA: O-antigen ligase family protein [Bryobacteraceae bacterium]|nr:O-antigen ligase family protein [Bryobacteraceae bacterium]